MGKGDKKAIILLTLTTELNPLSVVSYFFHLGHHWVGMQCEYQSVILYCNCSYIKITVSMMYSFHYKQILMGSAEKKTLFGMDILQDCYVSLDNKS